MAADGAIDRSRVLTATLDAPQRNFAAFRAGWFSRLHEALKPARNERAELCERYLDLLSSRLLLVSPHRHRLRRGWPDP